MNEQPWLKRSERWLRILLRLYPVDFRDEMGDAVVNTYRERCRTALRTRGTLGLMRVWLHALWDSLRNGLGERVRPAASWRRSGNWGRDMEIAMRRLVRAPMFMAAMVGTLTVGLGAFAVVYAVVQHVLIAPMAYERPDDLYFVWRDYGKIFDLKRGLARGNRRRRTAEVRRDRRGSGSSRPADVALDTRRRGPDRDQRDGRIAERVRPARCASGNGSRLHSR
jgi:hypothetical protein